MCLNCETCWATGFHILPWLKQKTVIIAAVLQSLNVLVGLGLSILTVGAIAAPAVFAAIRDANEIVVIVLPVGFAIVGDLTLARKVGKYANRRYSSAFAR